MIKLIAIVLLIYGIAGVVATFFIVGALRGPAQKMRELLQKLSEHLNKGSDSADKASVFINKAGPILQKMAEVLAQIVKVLRDLAARLGEAAGFIRGVEQTLNSVSIPVLAPQTRTLNLTFGFPVVTGMSLKEYEVVGIKVYGPPLNITTTNLGLNLGNVTVITGLNLVQVQPLQPVGNAFGAAGDKIDAAHQHVNNAGNRVDDVRDHTLEAKESVEKTAERLHDFAGKLEDASQNVSEMSTNKLLALIPSLVLGYFGLIHAAFALTGLALLFLKTP